MKQKLLKQKNPLRIAIIGQSNFAADVLELLLEKRYIIVGVFTIPDKCNREDILASTAKSYNIPVFKISSWRKKGVIIPEVLNKYKSIGANLNILPYCSQFIPMEVINSAELGSICYHPSILPRHRGASAISWTLIDGDDIAGFTIFWADDGLDTGPILLQKQCTIEPTDTLDILYKRFLYPQGIIAMGQAIDMIAKGIAPKIPQTEIGATYDAAMFREENQIINLLQSAEKIWNFIRGLDSVPGAIAYVEDENGIEMQIRLYGAHLYSDKPMNGRTLKMKGLRNPAIVHDGGILIEGTDGNYVNVKRVKKGNKMIQAKDWYLQNTGKNIFDLTEEELMKKKVFEIFGNQF